MSRRDWPAKSSVLPASTVWKYRDLDKALAIARTARALHCETLGPRRTRYGFEVQVTCTPAQADRIEKDSRQ